MENEFIKDIERRLKKSNKYVLYFNKGDIEKLLNIIKVLESSNVNKSKYIKEIEKQDCNIINIYIGGKENDKK